MLFNSFHFAYFFAFLLPTYWALRRWLVAQNVLLLGAAYYFYGCWNPKFLSLLILSTVMDFACGLWVNKFEDPRKRKACVAASMALNLGMLGYFKYCNFFAASLHTLLDRSGVHIPLWHLQNIILPIGISFYTFQSMSYVIDVYRKEIKPTRNLLEFATFVSFFPHLVAGPIMRPTILLPQIERKRRFDLQQFYSGAYLIFWGLTKKVVVADNLALFVSDLFDKWQTIDGGLALLAVYAFAFQIYCDFSGYTDAARGIAKMLGIELALNFNLPYFATSPKDFWNRWHISLSTWLRDYLYITLGGNRQANGNIFWKVMFGISAAVTGWMVFGPLRHAPVTQPTKFLCVGAFVLCGLGVVLPMRNKLALYRNLMLTMVIGGLWHGASWTFVAWGAYQGLLLVGHRMVEPLLARIKPTEIVDRACWKGLRIFVTFHLVCLGWLLFRAESMDQAFGMLSAITTRFAIPASATLLPILVCITPLLIYQLVQYLSKDLDVVFRTPWYVRSVFYTLLFYAFVLGGEFGGKQFIYFQF
jgi:D-alanyl-lipoteichoic acid acyltransferase DltB (MBOAT superfamily)